MQNWKNGQKHAKTLWKNGQKHQMTKSYDFFNGILLSIESSFFYNKNIVEVTAKAWYSVADYNGTQYDMPAQAAGNYKVCLMMNESTMLLSKKITVEQYVEKTYTELTFSDFGQEDRTVTAASQSFANITSWDNVAISGTIALPATGGSYISFGGNAVDKGVQIKYGGEDKIHMGVEKNNYCI